MKLAGIFLLFAGWGIVLSAIVLFSQAISRGSFVLAGMCLEAFGLFLTFRSSHGHSERGRMVE
uniref:Uncharacterized protein n=1 Tax=mine drainage metagenome TaxID=410659 RepID=E6Q0G3_9ZZZZ